MDFGRALCRSVSRLSCPLVEDATPSVPDCTKRAGHWGCRSLDGGESGIRTHGRFDPSPVFKTGALNRSAISPEWMRVGAGGLSHARRFAQQLSRRPFVDGARDAWDVAGASSVVTSVRLQHAAPLFARHAVVWSNSV